MDYFKIRRAKSVKRTFNNLEFTNNKYNIIFKKTFTFFNFILHIFVFFYCTKKFFYRKYINLSQNKFFKSNINSGQIIFSNFGLLLAKKICINIKKHLTKLGNFFC